MLETFTDFGESLSYDGNFWRRQGSVGVGRHGVKEPVAVGGAHGADYGVPHGVAVEGEELAGSNGGGEDGD